MERLTQRLERDLVKVNANGMMTRYTKANGKTVIDTVKELSHQRMEMSMLVNGSMTSDMDLA
jgi:hypothetical protein